jgi:hypothetical protein
MPTPEYFRKKRFKYNVAIAIKRSGTSGSLGNVINRKGKTIRDWKNRPISAPSDTSIDSLKSLAQFLFGESNHELLFTEIARKQVIQEESTQVLREDGNPELFFSKQIEQYMSPNVLSEDEQKPEPFQTASENPSPEVSQPQNTTSYSPMEELFLDIGRTLARTTLNFIHQATEIDKAIDILKQVKKLGGEKALAATISKWNR